MCVSEWGGGHISWLYHNGKYQNFIIICDVLNLTQAHGHKHDYVSLFIQSSIDEGVCWDWSS